MEGLTILAGVFDDNPPGGPFDDDSQVRGAAQSGTKFNLRTGALFIAEVQYAINQPVEGRQGHGGDPRRGCPAPTSSAPGSTPPPSRTSGSTRRISRSPIR